MSGQKEFGEKMDRRIERLTTEERENGKLKKKHWIQLNSNGYKRRKQQSTKKEGE